MRSSRSLAGWLATAFALLVIPMSGWWWVTAGQFDLGEWMNFGNVYEAQARSLLEGRFDVPCGVASGEAFVREGKCYVYFGIAPALLRLPFLPADPTHDGRRSRRMVLLANLLALVFVGLILVEAGHPPGSIGFSGYLLLVAFGSTIPSMWGWPTTYVEAISWAVAFSLASIYCLLRGWLVAACTVAILAFFARVSTGAGPMIAVALTAAVRPRRRSSIVTLALLMFAALGWLAYNDQRFGSYWTTIPVARHVQYDAARLNRINGTIFHPEEAPLIFAEYLLQLPRFRADYPWLEYRRDNVVSLSGMDMVDPHSGILLMMPALVWLAWAGWRAQLANRRVFWLLMCPWVGLVLLVTVAAINQRYLHEFLLLLAPAGAYGLSWAWGTPGRRIITAGLALWSLYACWALALVGQREVMPWINADALDQHRATKFQANRMMGLRGSPSPIEYDYRKDDPPPPVRGVRVKLINTESLFEHDGTRWRLQSGPPAHRFKVRINFAELPGGSTPILIAGKIPAADLVSLDRVSPSQYRVRLDHWGTYGEFGEPIEIKPDQEYVFACELDRLNSDTSVFLNGKLVARRHMPLWPWLPNEVAAPVPAVLSQE